LKESPSGRRSRFRASVFAVLKRLQGPSSATLTTSKGTKSERRNEDDDANKEGGEAEDETDIFNEKTVVKKDGETKPEPEVTTTPIVPKEMASTPILSKQGEKPLPVSSAKVGGGGCHKIEVLKTTKKTLSQLEDNL